jgi:hypothetical protein
MARPFMAAWERRAFGFKSNKQAILDLKIACKVAQIWQPPEAEIGGFPNLIFPVNTLLPFAGQAFTPDRRLQPCDARFRTFG